MNYKLKNKLKKLELEILFKLYRIKDHRIIEKRICKLLYVPHNLSTQDILFDYYKGNFNKENVLFMFEEYLGLR